MQKHFGFIKPSADQENGKACVDRTMMDVLIKYTH